MSLPAFVPLPPAKVRDQIMPSEWGTFLDSWTSLAEAYLSLSPAIFLSKAQGDRNQLFHFLASVFMESAQDNTFMRSNASEIKLRRLSFLLVKRIFAEDKAVDPQFCDLSFLGDFCTVYNGSAALNTVVEKLWSDQSLESSPIMLKNKSSLTHSLTNTGGIPSSDLKASLRRLVAFLKASPSYGLFLMQGSDFLDALVTAWEKGSEDVRSRVITIMYYAFSSLLHDESVSVSLLLDHLYSLSATGRRTTHKQEVSLLPSLLSNTPILHKLQSHAIVSGTGRGGSLLRSLESIKTASGSVTERPPRRRIGRGKERTVESDEVHAHKMSLVTEVQDLFPALDASIVIKFLDEFNDDMEKVVAHLLENPVSEEALRSEETNLSGLRSESADLAPSLAPRDAAIHVPSPNLPERRNVFDGDDLDTLEVAASDLHIGHRETRLEPSSSQNKAAILSALAAFDSDSDERDDTYDVDDVGGTVDTTMDAEAEANSNEEALYAVWKSSPEAFARDANTRRGKARTALRNDTGLTDEAIEGWALMLGRDPRRRAKLDAKYSTFKGQQTQLAPTAWRAASGNESEGEASGADHYSRNSARASGRARGLGRGGGRGGNVAGVAGERGTQFARQRKDANKGSRTNHNRRDQRARKITRAGFAI